MAKNNQTKNTNVTDEPIPLDVTLSKGEAFIEEHWKQLAAALGVVVVVVLGAYWWKSNKEQKELAAQEAIAITQMAFMAEQWDVVLQGDTINHTKGALAVIKEHDGTKTANLARAYAGIAYAKKGETKEAIKMLEAYDVQDDQMVSPMVLAALGNQYIDDGQTDKGISTIIKAAEKANNEGLTPVLLFQAARTYEASGKKDEALKLYERIKKEYTGKNPIANDVDQYIEHAK